MEASIYKKQHDKREASVTSAGAPNSLEMKASLPIRQTRKWLEGQQVSLSIRLPVYGSSLT